METEEKMILSEKKNSGKRILILMSTWNGERYLRGQMDSFLRQRNVQISLLVRDDGSSDRTAEVLDEYQDRISMRVIQGENIGVAASFMKLMGEAPDGFDYYACSDQDDVWEDDKLIRAVNVLEHITTAKGYRMYYSGQKLVDERLRLLGEHICTRKRSPYANFFLNPAAGCTIVFTQSLLDAAKRRGSGFPQFHDAYLLRLCLALGGVCAVDPHGRILYRQHGTNAVGLDYKHLRGKWRLFLRHLRSVSARQDATEILKDFGSEIDPLWRRYLSDLSRARTDLRCRFRLITDRAIRFEDRTSRIMFLIKLLSGKL